MDTEKIDMLLIDHALNATPPDVAALVDAFVEKDREARARLDNFRATASAAKRVIAGDAELPPLPRTLPCLAGPLVGPRKSFAPSRVQRAALWTASIAACMAVSFFIGAHTRSPNDSPSTIAQISPARIEPEKNATPARVAAVQNFWSVSSLEARAVENSARSENSRSDWTNLIPNAWQRSARFGG